MNKILITGTAGFIGFHLVERLLREKDWDIVGLDNLNDYYNITLKYARLNETGISKDKIKYNELIVSTTSKYYRFIKLDLTDKEKILQLFEIEKFDYVINLAAQAGVRYSLENPYSYIESNILGFLNILEGCRRFPIKYLIYASSSSVYGANKKIPFSETDIVDNPISLYAATKKSNELMAYTYSHLYRIASTGLRFFTVYGPWGRPDMAPFIFAKAILEGRPIKVFNNGKMQRDFTYIEDVVEGIYKLLELITSKIKNHEIEVKPNPLILNIGNNEPKSLEYFIELLEKYLGKKAIKEYHPLQPGDLLNTYADIEMIKKFGFKPSISLEVGIKKFVEWYKQYYS
ncbi:MAG: NAD-dependent epimerase/dehydratase family protein [Stygiobacter sp.]|nr:MAG: NAD-dependent epimerase/dehydratase family protein [Stygiobacter sp.]